MGGIFGSLQMSLRTLSNNQVGIQVVNENVANVNTEGYSRRRVIFGPGDVQIYSFGTLGTGADINEIQSVRDIFLEARILAEYQAKGFYEGQQFGVSQLETVISGVEGAGVSEQLSRFFDAFLELSGEPSALALRQAVIAEGEGLAWSIRNTARQLSALDQGNQIRIEDTVNSINGLLDRIYEVNQRLVPLLNRGLDGGSLYDERQLLLNQLSEQIGVQIQSDSRNNLIISTATGRLLMAGPDVTHLSVERTSEGAQVMFGDLNISAEITSGRLGGLLEFQDTTLAESKRALNALAAELVVLVNSAHAGGVDLNGDAGSDFFTAATGNEANTIAVAFGDPALVAAAGVAGALGDGDNAQALADLRDQALAGLGGQTLGDFYAQTLFDVGLAARSIKANFGLQQKVVSLLEAQRESVSGVSLDEEAVNLIQFQRSYQASAKLVRILDELMEETINLVRG